MSGAEIFIPCIWAASSFACAYYTSLSDDKPDPEHMDEIGGEESPPARIVVPTVTRMTPTPEYLIDNDSSIATMVTAELSLNFSWSNDSSAFAPYTEVVVDGTPHTLKAPDRTLVSE